MISDDEMQNVKLKTEHRVFVWWEAGGYLSTLTTDFNQALQHMVKHFGPPTGVEFRADGEGWERK